MAARGHVLSAAGGSCCFLVNLCEVVIFYASEVSVHYPGKFSIPKCVK